MSEFQRDFDILEVPLEGVAAYWLSLKKLVGTRRNFKGIEEEAAYTNEPYIKHLLDVGFRGYAQDRIRMLAETKAETLLNEVDRRFRMMRAAVLDVATGENPHRTLAKLFAQFPALPVDEERAMQLAQELVKLVPEHEAGKGRFFDVGLRSQDDKLVVTLLFYVLLSRHEGKIACQPLLKYVTSRFFRDGLAMVIDGFDTPFVRKWLKRQHEIVLDDAARKMRLSTELCLCIARKEDYEDIYRVARSFMR